jgi:hypothetical protein
MGLLDDAIREHLELKRRSGADPGEIAHQERAALEPVFPEEPVGSDAATGGHADDRPHVDELGEPAETPPTGGEPAHEAGPPEPVAAGQETAELDMRTVLEDGDHSVGDLGEPPAGAPAHAASSGEHGEDDLLEWEMPHRDAGEQMHDEVPGQERLSFE